MSTWAIVFLGLIALASLTQTTLLMLVLLEGRRLARRVDALQDHLEKDLRPTLEGLARISRNFAEISDLTVLEARRIDAAIADAVDRFQDLTRELKSLLLRPLGPLVDVMAFIKGIERGVQVYRQLSGHDARERGASRRYAEEDEHLFI